MKHINSRKISDYTHITNIYLIICFIICTSCTYKKKIKEKDKLDIATYHCPSVSKSKKINKYIFIINSCDISLLIKLLYNPSSDIRVCAAQILGELHNMKKSSTTYLAKRVYLDRSYKVKWAALNSIVKLNYIKKDSLLYLLRIRGHDYNLLGCSFNDPGKQIRRRVNSLLMKLGPSIFPELISILSQKHHKDFRYLQSIVIQILVNLNYQPKMTLRAILKVVGEGSLNPFISSNSMVKNIGIEALLKMKAHKFYPDKIESLLSGLIYCQQNYSVMESIIKLMYHTNISRKLIKKLTSQMNCKYLDNEIKSMIKTIIKKYNGVQ